MIEETGLIVEADGRYVWVEAASGNSCSHCSVSEGCGTASLQKWFKRKPNRLRVVNDKDVRPGDRVVIGIPEQALVRGSFMIYMVPLLALIAGAMIGVYVNNSMGWGHKDGISIVFGIVSLIVSFSFLKKYIHQSGRDSRYQPVILRRTRQDLQQ